MSRGQKNLKDSRLLEVVGHSAIFGDEKTIEVFKLSDYTLDRYKRDFRDRFGGAEIDRRAIVEKVANRFSDKELQAILSGSDIDTTGERVEEINFDGDEITIGVISDTHIGSKYSDFRDIETAFEEMEKANVNYIMMPGDITEGMSNRPGHVYELSDIGYDAQKKQAIDILSQSPAPIYAIDGNHDRWYIKSNGAKIVKDIADAVPQMTFCGHDTATIKIKGCKIMLWHGEDGASYATSYRPQKIIESISGGKKPNIILAGHDHKSMYLFDRNIHFISSGTMQSQTAWMRGKRLVSHVGFWIIKIKIGHGQVKTFSPTWYPYYK